MIACYKCNYLIYYAYTLLNNRNHNQSDLKYNNTSQANDTEFCLCSNLIHESQTAKDLSVMFLYL